MKPSSPVTRPGIVPFAIAITVLNLLGHLWLGFEQAWLTPFVAVGAAYVAEMAIEVCINGWQRSRFRGGARQLIMFLLPAHISGLAVGMLLYTNQRFAVVAFAAAFAIFSKVLFRVPVPEGPAGRTIHFMNPSNFGIAVTLLLFNDYVGVAQPYQFTENITGNLDWILPLIIVCSGSFLNWRATKRIVLVMAWLAGFAGQAYVRSVVTNQEVWIALAPMTGMAFVLFTFYMISDPMTTPKSLPEQIVFGLATAAVYGALSHYGITFGLFFSLCIICAGRGALIWFANIRYARAMLRHPRDSALPLAR
ncbi:MAG: hypothetical protein WKG03_09685 [Telluria sp.]